MTLPVATRLGPYEVLSFVGAGGMGEVYRVRDHRLSREAALKILPAGYSADPDRLMRFEREARAMAAITHDNVLAIFDVGRFDGRPYLVTELLDGQSLRAWLESTKPSIGRAAEIGAQIARGLAVAHARGVFHRDLKPENVFVLRDGRVKILDFGLAKLREVTESEVTITRHDVTESGIVLGTAAYMAPEQARGLPVDGRADIFALGAVLYELFSGRRAFTGTTRADVLTAVIKDDPPPLADSGRTVPPLFERIVRRCLEKESEARFHAASDLAFALDAVSVSSSVNAADVPNVGAARRWRHPVAYVLLALAAAAAGYWLRPMETSPPQSIVRFSIPADPTASWPVSIGVPSVAIDPAGQTVAWVIPGNRHSLMIRRLGETEPRRVEGTVGATSPFFSPDGRWIAFHVDGTLKRVLVDGGVPTTICHVDELRGAAWGEDDRIVYATLATGVWSVPSGGGQPESLLPTDKTAEYRYIWPTLLPGGKTVILTRRAGFGLEAGILVAVDLATKLVRDLHPNADDGAYAVGRLFFGRGESLWSVPFDPARAVVTGPDGPVIDQVERAAGNGETQFAISATGTLVFVPFLPRRQVAPQLLDAAGKVQRAFDDIEPGGYDSLVVSPDRTRVALRTLDHLIITRLDVRSTIKIPGAVVGSGLGVAWTPDSRRVLFAGGPRVAAIFSISADGTGSPEPLTTPGRFAHYVVGVTKDGAVIYQADEPGGGRLFRRLPSGDTRPLALPPGIREATASPDGRWLIYRSTSVQLMLQAMDRDAASAVPVGEGESAFWAEDGTRIFFLRRAVAGGTDLVWLPVRDGAVPAGARPQIQFPCPDCTEVTGAGATQFMVLRRVAVTDRPAIINVALNWTRGFDKR